MELLMHLQKLDAVLDYLRSNEDRKPALEETYVTTADVSNHLVSKFGYVITLKELSRIYDKLTNDGFISRIDGNCYLTYDGYVFIGYEKKQILDTTMAQSLSIAKGEAKQSTRRLLLATWCAGIAAVLLLLWQVWIWFYPVHANYPFWIWETIQK